MRWPTPRPTGGQSRAISLWNAENRTSGRYFQGWRPYSAAADNVSNSSMALDLSYQAIGADTLTRGFNCGARELDRFLSGKAVKQHERGTILTTCAYLPNIPAPVGYYSIASVAEEVANLPDRPYHRLGECEHFPAVQMVYLAVHRAHQGQGIGSAMAGAVISLFAETGQRLGIPHLVLVPINDAVIPFYEDLGFACYLDRCRMYLPLRDAVEAMKVPAANETGDLFQNGAA